ncbi:phosphoesterase PA-phosphatase related [Chthoniobacter flavus Ellin428]|uniref:Phosphoesterase PA-phosphatase related n=1 Tax=Chthoniobacter flavus Ellin428 TaxID=497964 RepID=B4CZL6_9BACT|nr:phosphatase PAP2 family protein [Chthoniobacter flavus]EDY20180.1 phosphoesterase PA-phosphatase related [Chthoniobacter flavus Ellin428]
MDQKLLFLINRQWIGPTLDRIMALFSSFDAWVLPMLILIALLLWRGGFRTRAFVLCAGIIVGINDGAISNSIKHLVSRPRPYQSIDGVRQVDLGKAKPRMLAVAKPLKIKLSAAAPDLQDLAGRSFPSSHTINTVSVALLATCFYRRRGWLAFIPAALVGYSRIYCGSHWPSDILASIFIGLGATLLLFCLLEWLWKKWAGSVLPAVHTAHPSLLHS